MKAIRALREFHQAVQWKARKRRAIKNCCRNRCEGKLDGVVCGGHCVRGRDHG